MTSSLDHHRDSTAYLNSSCISATWSSKRLSRSHRIFLHSLWKSKATYLPKEKIFKTDQRVFIFFLLAIPSQLIFLSLSQTSRGQQTLLHGGLPTGHTHANHVLLSHALPDPSDRSKEAQQHASKVSSGTAIGYVVQSSLLQLSS